MLSPMHRRAFLQLTGGAPLAAAALSPNSRGPRAAPPVRDAWVTRLQRVAHPVLTHLAEGTLRAAMPVEQAAGADRAEVTHLEAVGRLFAGLAPWLELAGVAGEEAGAQARARQLARDGLARAVDPASPDLLNFTRQSQPLVDAAFLAQAILRAPGTLAATLDATTRPRVIAALESTRAITPGFSNWLLFSAMVEAGLKALGAPWDRLRVDYALRQHDQWYQGDGMYGDGPTFHWDYYNSYVIHPMLVDVLQACAGESSAWDDLRIRVAARARRYAAILERLVAPDGSFPAVGRSIAYRCGAFHLLAQSALHHALPDELSAAQARGALTAVIARTLDAPGTFDADGWLQIGLAGHQPGLGERYISTGSLYLCAVAFLPLGLPPSDPFWSGSDVPWTSRLIWDGRPAPIDHAFGG
jgi:hypothetical protein